MIALPTECPDTPAMRTTVAVWLPIVLLSGCSPAFPRPAAAYDYAREAPAAPPVPELEELETAAAPVEQEMVAMARSADIAPHHGHRGQRVAQAMPAENPISKETPPAPREMLDIEASLDMVVEQVATAAIELRKLVRAQGGVLIEDHVDEAGSSRARFLIRVDAPKTDALLTALERLGEVRSRQVDARDIGKQYHDAQLQLENLKVAMSRYEQVLGKADKVAEILTIERELTRLRGEIEQVKGNLRWMQDRAARSTIHVHMISHQVAELKAPIVPEAKFYPGLRLLFLEDLRGNDIQNGYVGGGISLRANRYFSLDLDGLRRRSTGSPTKGLDVVLATIGGELFSEFLGNGTRRFLNPYLGWRLGYARFNKRNEFALGATVGLEVVKTRYLRVDLAVRGLGLLGHTLHMAVQPELTLGFAF
jgi:hypothetical protein